MIDFRGVAGVIPDGTTDGEVLRIAADDVRVLVSRDINTMPKHFAEFVSRRSSPGLILIHSRRSIGSVVDSLFVVRLTWTADDCAIKRDGFLKAECSTYNINCPPFTSMVSPVT
jgi:hypothetical protein